MAFVINSKENGSKQDVVWLTAKCALEHSKLYKLYWEQLRGNNNYLISISALN